MQRILIIIDLNFCVFWINIKRIIRCVDCPTIRQPKQGLTSFWFFHPHLSNDTFIQVLDNTLINGQKKEEEKKEEGYSITW